MQFGHRCELRMAVNCQLLLCHSNSAYQLAQGAWPCLQFLVAACLVGLVQARGITLCQHPPVLGGRKLGPYRRYLAPAMRRLHLYGVYLATFYENTEFYRDAALAYCTPAAMRQHVPQVAPSYTEGGKTVYLRRSYFERADRDPDVRGTTAMQGRSIDGAWKATGVA